MKYKIDIDELYGLKQKKILRYQSGGNFIKNYLEYYTNPDSPQRTYVLFDAARQANLPFKYPVGQGGLFDYTIASDNPDNTHGTNLQNNINGYTVDPYTTYLEIDPSTGQILNGQYEGDIVFNGTRMQPILSGNYVYHPEMGWIQSPQGSGQITSTSKAQLASRYREILAGWGMENAWNMDDDAVLDLAAATGIGMTEGAAGILTGELFASAVNGLTRVPKIVELATRYPRTTAFTGAVGTQVVPGFAAGVQNAKNKKEEETQSMSPGERKVDNHMRGIKYFTGQNFKQAGGEDNLEGMVEWLSHNGYNVAQLEDGTYTLEKKYLFWHIPKGVIEDFWPTIVGVGSMAYSGVRASNNNRRMAQNNQNSGNKGKKPNGKGTLLRKADGTRTKFGKGLNALGWTSQILGTMYGQYYQSFEKENDEKAEQLVDYLVRNGYARYGNPQSVLMEQEYAPKVQTPGVDSVSEVMDSVGAVQDFNSGQETVNSGYSDSVNQNANRFRYQTPATTDEQ